MHKMTALRIAFVFGLKLDHVGSYPTFAPVDLEYREVDKLTLDNRHKWTLQ